MSERDAGPDLPSGANPARSGRRSILARAARGLAAVAGIFVVTMLLLEIVLRAFPSIIPPDALRIFNADLRTRLAARRGLISSLNVEPVPRDDGGPAYRLWRFKPGASWGSTPMDSMGFCNRPANLYGSRATFDIVTIGDSFTFCWNVPPESMWPALLGPEVHASLYNLGLPDMGIHEEVQFLKRFGLDKHPRLVILGFYEGNDLRDAVKVQAFRTAQGTNPSGAGDAGRLRASLPRRVFFALMDAPPARWSYAYNLMVAGLGLFAQRVTEKRAENGTNFRYHLNIGGRTIPMNTDNADSDELEFARDLAAGRVTLAVFNDALVDFAATARAHNFVPVVAYFPSAHTIYRSAVVFDDSTAARLTDSMHASQLAYMARLADSLHLRFVDLTPALAAAVPVQPEGTLLFRPNDLHMTTGGHAVVARALSAVVGPLLKNPPTP